MTQGLSVSSPGTPVRPIVARTATVSSTPRTAVAVSGIVYGVEKPDTAACGADAAPVSNAAQTAQRWPPWHPRAVLTLSAAAARPTTTSPAADAGCRTATMTRPHRVRSRAAAAASITPIRRPAGRLTAAGDVVLLPAPEAGCPGAGSGSSARDLVVLLQLLSQRVQRVVQP